MRQIQHTMRQIKLMILRPPPNPTRAVLIWLGWRTRSKNGVPPPKKNAGARRARPQYPGTPRGPSPRSSLRARAATPVVSARRVGVHGSPALACCQEWASVPPVVRAQLSPGGHGSPKSHVSFGTHAHRETQLNAANKQKERSLEVLHSVKMFWMW